MDVNGCLSVVIRLSFLVQLAFVASSSVMCLHLLLSFAHFLLFYRSSICVVDATSPVSYLGCRLSEVHFGCTAHVS